MTHSCGGLQTAMVTTEEEIEAMKKELWQHYDLISDSFDFFAAKGASTGDAFQMQLVTFFMLLEEAHILDKHCKRRDADVIFTAANIEEDSGTAEGKANADRYVAQCVVVCVCVCSFVSVCSLGGSSSRLQSSVPL